MYSLNSNLTLERNFYFCLSFSNYFCCSSYSLNWANIALYVLIMIPVLHYLFFILHSIDFFRKVSSFSKINSALYYYEFIYKHLKCLNKYQQFFVNLLTELCVILSVVYLLFKAPFMLLIRSTNSFCSYHWILMSVCTDQWWAVIWLFYANLSCISIKRCMCVFIGQNSYDNSFLFLFIFCFIIVTQTWWYWNQSRVQKKIIKMFFMLSLECK